MTAGLSLVDDDQPLGLDELGSRIIGMAGRLAAATCRWLLLVAEFDARAGYARFVLPTTARWLSHYCSISRRTAIEHVRVARALAAHPSLVDAMSAGRISYSHVRAISRLSELATPQLIDDLIVIAEHGTVGQLEDMVRGLRTVDHHNAETPQPEEEAVSRRWRADSRMGLSAKLDPEHGALFWSALETVAAREQLTHAQALTRLAEIALAALNASDERPAPSLRGDEHAAVVVHLAATAEPAAHHDASQPASQPAPLRSAERRAGSTGAAQNGPDRDLSDATEPVQAIADGTDPERLRSPERPALALGRLPAGPGLPPRVVERLACAGRVRVMVFDPRVPPGEAPTPLDAGYSRRLVSTRQFRALLARDGGGCAHPGCGSTIGLEAHHVRHWLHGGPTNMANLVLLCRRHHHAHHDGAFRIISLGGGRFRFETADGRELPRHIDPAQHLDSATKIEDEHADVAADAATTRWDGSRLDHGCALAGLAEGLHSAQRRETTHRERRTTRPDYDPWASGAPVPA